MEGPQSPVENRGRGRLRKALYMPAMVAWQHNPAIRSFYERLRKRGKNGKLILGAAMRKLLCIAFAILKSGQPFDAKRALAEG